MSPLTVDVTPLLIHAPELLTLVPYDLAGKTLNFAPKWTVNASASKRFDLGGELLNEQRI